MNNLRFRALEIAMNRKNRTVEGIPSAQPLRIVFDYY